MITKIKAYMEQFHMVKPGDTVLIGLSGGADSVCLFFLLKEMLYKSNIQMAAIHVNHMLRGDAALADEEFVRGLCEKEEIPCYIFRSPVQEISLKKGLSLEEAGREVRYDLFTKTAKEIGAAKIALAHHQNDQAETMLFHLARGCGLTGLRGIRPVRSMQEFIIIRPLLCVTRLEIEQFLLQRKISFCIDTTNEENIYSRNLVRNKVIPLLEQQIGSKTVLHMAATADLLGEADDYCKFMTDKSFHTVVQIENNIFKISIPLLLNEHSYMQKEIIKKALEDCALAKKDIERVHVLKVLGLCELQTGRHIDLPYGIQAFKEYEFLLIQKKGQAEVPEKVKTVKLILPEAQKSNEIVLDDLYDKKVLPFQEINILRMAVFARTKDEEVPKNLYTKWFDYDKIKEYLCLRPRQAGDYYYCSNEYSKKLKSYFIDEKVPRNQRDSIPLIAEGSHILWVIGGRISHYYKVDENTKYILEFKITGG